jgi:hypothetical protein
MSNTAGRQESVRLQVLAEYSAVSERMESFMTVLFGAATIVAAVVLGAFVCPELLRPIVGSHRHYVTEGQQPSL